MAPFGKEQPRTKTGHDLLAILLLFLFAGLLFLLIEMPTFWAGQTPEIVAGMVAKEDVSAPAGIEYISEVKTDEVRAMAEMAVLPVFSQPDYAISRQQISRLRTVLDEIDAVRNDQTTRFEEKQIRLLQVSALALEKETIDQLLIFSDARWEAVRSESLRVLELVMRSPVREENVSVKKSTLGDEISLTLTEEQNSTVLKLVTPFIIPNSTFSPELTDQARQKARQEVTPITRSYAAGELVIQKGRIISAAEIEALGKLGILDTSDTTERKVGTLAVLAGLMAFVGIYYHRRRPPYYFDPKSLMLIGILLIIFVLSARLVIPNRAVLPYLLPLPAFSLLVTTLFGSSAGLVFSIVLAILAPFGYGISNELTVFYLLSSLTGVVSLGKGYRISSFAWSGLTLSLVGIVVVIAYRIPAGNLDWIGLATLAGACLVNGIASASLALLLQYFLADLFGLTTGLRLLEISRSDAPLLKHFLRTAPGTYQHSLMVANLAEQAGEKLGLDSLLLRVGALYHDIGKTANPAFFIENQLPTNLDAHDNMPAVEVAQLVIRHVTDGRELAKKYRLPSRIIDFIMEHHGTMTAKYLYNRALAEAQGDASKLDIGSYRYPGPSPRSKETGLLMLADNIEARTRSERPKSETEIINLVNKGIETCQKEGQLANTPFTFRDLAMISEAFATTLTGLYHPRIAYPNNEVPDAPKEEK